MSTPKQLGCLSLFFIINIFSLNAQTNTFPSSGAVGINTTSPLAHLHVNGSIRGEGVGQLRIQTDYGYIKLGPANSGWSHFTTDREKFYFNRRIVIGGGRSISAYQDYPLKFSTGSGSAEVMRLMPNGNVGIGVTDPLATLHVNGAIRGAGTGALEVRTDFGYIDIGPKNSSFAHFNTDRPQFYFNKRLIVGGDNSVSSFGSNPLILKTNSGTNEVMRITSTDKVGIGTIDPQTKLDVAGDLRIGDSQQNLPGVMRWNGSDFEGYDGNEWLSFTGGFQPPQILWSTPPNSCSSNGGCPEGYASAADANGKVCKNAIGGKGNAVLYGQINPFAQPSYNDYVCVNAGGNTNFHPNDELAQCHCVLVNPQQALVQGDNTILQNEDRTLELPPQKPNVYKLSLNAKPVLQQNVPNPFNETTEIIFTLPPVFNSASIIISDSKGIVIQSLDVNTKGDNIVNIDATGLNPGQYQYSLIIDGGVAATRIMIKQ